MTKVERPKRYLPCAPARGPEPTSKRCEYQHCPCFYDRNKFAGCCYCDYGHM